jgi:hypothetical protein
MVWEAACRRLRALWASPVVREPWAEVVVDEVLPLRVRDRASRPPAVA